MRTAHLHDAVPAYYVRFALPLCWLSVACGSTAFGEPHDASESAANGRIGLEMDCPSSGAPSGRLRGVVYSIPVGTRKLPDFGLLRPIGSLCTNGLAVSEQRRFPGIPTRGEWFAIDFRGDFTVETAGTYRFRLTSDDGSRLYVDGTDVVNNDGFHTTISKEGVIPLGVGHHTIAVPYWQGPGPLSLTLEVAREGGPFDAFHTDLPL